jgi:AcrR family transcriptional regulator
VDSIAGVADAPTSLRQQHKQLTRRRIVEAALAVFDRDGYVGARIEDVATAAGASRATFYLHFGSKLEVVRELLGPLVDESRELYRELDALEDPSWSALRGWLERALAYWQRNRTAISAVNQALAAEPALTDDFVDAVWLSVDAMTHHLARWSGVERAEAHLRAALFVLQLERFNFLWVIRGASFDREAALDALTDSLWLALHPGAVPRDRAS